MTDKPTLILLPGLLCDAALWRHQIENLGDLADIRVADFSTQDSIADMAAAALALADGPIALAGLSMGGYVALEIMRRAPERVTHLAIIASSARPDTDEQVRRRKGLIELAEIGRFKGVTPRLLPLLIHHNRLDDTELTSTVKAMAEGIGKDGFLRQQKAVLGRIDSRPGLAAITCPTLIIAGRDDALLSPEASVEMAEAIPGAAMVMVENCGHLATLEQPEALTALLRYWLQKG